MKNYLLLSLLFVFFVACDDQSTATKTAIAPVAKTEITPAEQPKEFIQFIEFPKSSSFPDAKLESMDYKNGKFSFTYSGTDYKLGEQTPEAKKLMCANSDQGQHIHLIIDNQPYLASYATGLEIDIHDGDHIILAFLSRSYHESIKNGQAHIAKKVKVSKGNIISSQDIKEPMVFYSRPKGTYVGKKETQRVLFDYFLINVKPGDGHKVRMKINDEPPILVREWKPRYIKGLPLGENTITLTLLNKKGDPVKSKKMNPVQRKFTLVADPAPAQ